MGLKIISMPNTASNNLKKEKADTKPKATKTAKIKTPKSSGSSSVTESTAASSSKPSNAARTDEAILVPNPPIFTPNRQLTNPCMAIPNTNLNVDVNVNTGMPRPIPHVHLIAPANVPSTLRPKITTTFWEDESTICYQVEVNGVSVARREDNNFVNGTKLLNVVGMTRGRRDGLLKSERIRDVVKIGSMNLKGVWIPFNRAAEMANREGVYDALYPLFVPDIKGVLESIGIWHNPTNSTGTGIPGSSAYPIVFSTTPSNYTNSRNNAIVKKFNGSKSKSSKNIPDPKSMSVLNFKTKLQPPKTNKLDKKQIANGIPANMYNTLRLSKLSEDNTTQNQQQKETSNDGSSGYTNQPFPPQVPVPAGQIQQSYPPYYQQQPHVTPPPNTISGNGASPPNLNDQNKPQIPNGSSPGQPPYYNYQYPYYPGYSYAYPYYPMLTPSNGQQSNTTAPPAPFYPYIGHPPNYVPGPNGTSPAPPPPMNQAFNQGPYPPMANLHISNQTLSNKDTKISLVDMTNNKGNNNRPNMKKFKLVEDSHMKKEKKKGENSDANSKQIHNIIGGGNIEKRGRGRPRKNIGVAAN